jgi:hypothetical protein
VQWLRAWLETLKMEKTSCVYEGDAMVHCDIVCKYGPGLDSPQKIAHTKLVILLRVYDL